MHARGRIAGAVLMFALGTTGCGASGAANAPGQAGTPYSGASIALFDDAIDSAAVGLDFGKTYAPSSDPELRRRVKQSDAVVRVRVDTVTSRNDGPRPTYEVRLRALEQPLAGSPPEGGVSVNIGSASESYGIVRSLDGALVGRTFIAFLRTFSRPDGERETHFHLSPDSSEVKTAVANALALGELE